MTGCEVHGVQGQQLRKKLRHPERRPEGVPGKEVKNPPAVWETWVGSLGWEDPLEKGKALHSSILAWRTPWTEGPGGL